MFISEFDYHLPTELIAQQPLADRAASRMMVVNRAAGGSFRDPRFTELSQLMRPDDLLVLNNTKVFPARLFGRIESGAVVEIFLVRQREDATWESAAACPAKRLKAGTRIAFDGKLSAQVIDKTSEGRIYLEFDAGVDIFELLDEIGKTPLPPYIKRDAVTIDIDRERYQTVFAKKRGAIAAPTAGLHFTSEVLQAIQSVGVTIAEITLHVGYGTFEPVRVDDLIKHHVSPESYVISDEAASSLNAAKRGGRIVAIGTTTTRALEHNLTAFDTFTSGSHNADLTITPGYQFRAVDALLTNFHLPKSSLLVLVSTFAGHELIMSAYQHAVAEKYRFYSYGDCMLII